MKIDKCERGRMRRWNAGEQQNHPLFDGESGRTNSLKEVHTQQTAAVDVPAMWGLFKYAVLQ